MPQAETGKAVQVLDLLLDYFGERGERWTRDRYDDGDGRRCLVGALHYLRCQHRVSSESAECFLHEAIKQGRPYRMGGLVYFNDRCQELCRAPHSYRRGPGHRPWRDRKRKLRRCV